MYGAAQERSGKLIGRHQDWFDENDQELRTLIDEKNLAHFAMLRQHHATCFNRNRFTAARQALFSFFSFHIIYPRHPFSLKSKLQISINKVNNLIQ